LIPTRVALVIIDNSSLGRVGTSNDVHLSHRHETSCGEYMMLVRQPTSTPHSSAVGSPVFSSSRLNSLRKTGCSAVSFLSCASDGGYICRTRSRKPSSNSALLQQLSAKMKPPCRTYSLRSAISCSVNRGASVPLKNTIGA